MGTITEMPDTVFNADTTNAAADDASDTGTDALENFEIKTLYLFFLAFSIMIPDLADRILPTIRLSDLIYVHSLSLAAVSVNQALIFYDYYPIRKQALLIKSIDFWNNFQKGLEDGVWLSVAFLMLLTTCICFESDVRKKVHGLMAIAHNCTSRILFSGLIYGNWHYEFVMPVLLFYYLTIRIRMANPRREHQNNSRQNSAPQ